MSTGGIFKLMSNSGIQDKLLMASDYLDHRVKLMCRNHKNKINNGGSQTLDLDKSWLPDINSISKSHMMFINGAFKPFVSSGFEYNKSKSIGIPNFGTTISFTVPQFGDFINDAVVHIKMSRLESVDNRDRVRYAAMLGHKIFKRVEFKINANVLDTYESDDYNAFYEFKVPPAKQIGWLRNIGQEIPIQGNLSSDPTYDMFQEYRLIGCGNQTLKQRHEPIDLWIPILFWFKDIRNALPTIAIPFGQTNINIQLASVAELVGFADYGGGGAYTPPTITSIDLYINNIFMNPNIVKIFIAKFGFSLIRVHGHHQEATNKPGGMIKLNSLRWPTETLYLCFKPHANSNLSQYWHKCCSLTLGQIKVPVVARDSLLITRGTVTNVTATTVDLVYTSGPAITSIDDDYNGYDFVITGGTGFVSSDIVRNRYIISDYVGATQTITINSAWDASPPDSTTTFELSTPQLGINSVQYYTETPTIDTLKIVAHGIDIYSETPESFYNSYLPYRFGRNMNTPTDRGWYMLNFNYLPGEYQPSGHINLSRAREFYLMYTSSFINSTNQTNITVLSDAINFLLIADGTAALRFST